MELIAPTISALALVAPNANLIGSVTSGEETCVWHGATLNGADSS